MKILKSVIFCLFFINLSLSDCQLIQIFNQKININVDYLKVEDFFKEISEETKIKFKIFPLDELEKKDLKISVKGYNNKPLYQILENMANNFNLKYEIRFEKENPVILVNFENSHILKMKYEPGEKLKIQLDKAPIKDLFNVIEDYTGKKVILKGEDFSEIKVTIKEDEITIEELLEKLSKSYSFYYKIADKEIIIIK